MTQTGPKTTAAPILLGLTKVEALILRIALDGVRKMTLGERTSRALAFLTRMHQATEALADKLAPGQLASDQDADALAEETGRLIAEYGGGAEVFTDLRALAHFSEKFLVDAAETMLCDGHKTAVLTMADALHADHGGDIAEEDGENSPEMSALKDALAFGERPGAGLS